MFNTIKWRYVRTLLPFLSGTPLATIYASPIVSTLYTSYVSILQSNVEYISFSNSTTLNEKYKSNVSCYLNKIYIKL